MKSAIIPAALALAAILAQPGPAAAQTGETADIAAMQAALHDLAARESIRELLHAYGRTIDARDFEAFAALWAEDAEYVGGPGMAPLAGPDAIAGFMRDIITENPLGFGEPNAHLSFNEQIVVTGDRATAASITAFITPGEDGVQQLSIVTVYDDRFVQEDGVWKFARRAGRGLVNPQN